MSSPLPDVAAYWQTLSASNPTTQTLEGQGLAPQFDEPKAAAQSASPLVHRFRNDHNL